MRVFYSVPFASFLQDTGISPHYRRGSDFMRAKPVAVEDQYRLIMECRSSGLTDYQWCIEHDIKPGTFYNWVKRLRQKGTDLPANGMEGKPARQEVVRLDIPKPQLFASVVQPAVLSPSENHPNETSTGFPTVDLSLAGAILRIPQQTDPAFLEQLIRILKNELC